MKNIIGHCDRCNKKSDSLNVINPSNSIDGFSKRRTLLCKECRELWHIAFGIINVGKDFVFKEEETAKAWEEFMSEGKEKVQFT